MGITWILDGLEVTVAGSVAAALKQSPALRFSDLEVGVAGSAYLGGAVLGALFFGWLTDRLGRKKLFFITIAVYLTATALTGLSWNGFSFFLFRFFTGCGIGGEYAAINSTIQELIPARYRGHIDLMINGSSGRVGARRCGRGRDAQPGADLSGVRMAACLLDRRGARRGRLGFPRARAGSRSTGGRRKAKPSSPESKVGFAPMARVSCQSRTAPPFACARATILRLRKCLTHSSGATA